MNRFLRGLTALLLLHASSPAQETFDLRGKVMGPDSSAIVGATVRSLNSLRETVTDPQGGFVLRALPRGRHVLEVTAAGMEGALLPCELRSDTTVSLRLPILATTLGEVVVSADRREQAADGSGLSLTVLDNRKITDFRIWDLGGLSGLAPNLYSADPGDGRFTTYIRGIGTTSYDPAVATYVDGVSQFNLDTYLPQLADVERIEVLRGPQGTLYGRNAMGGVINVVTRKPTNRRSFTWESNVGSHGIHRHLAGVRLPLVKDRLFLSMTGMYQARQGFHLNDFTGADFDRQRSWNGQLQLRYLPRSDWSLSLDLKQRSMDNEGAFPLAPDRETAFRAPFMLNQNATATMLDRGLNASFVARHEGKSFQMVAQTAYQRNRRIYDSPLDGDFSPLDIVSIVNDFEGPYNRVGVWTQELRFSSPAARMSALKWTAGLYLFDQDNPVKQSTVFGADAGLFGIPDKNFSITTRNSGRATGFALFGQAVWELSDRLSLTLGLRRDAEWRRMTVGSEYRKPPQPAFPLGADTSATAFFRAVSPRIGLEFRSGERSLFHVQYARGFRPGGLTTLGTDPSQPPLFAYDPEHSDNVEVGWKSTSANGRLKFRAAAFLARVADAQVPTLLLPDAVTVTRNAGLLVSRGMEADLEATPVKGLWMQYSLGVTDASYRRLKLSQNGQSVDLAGNRQVFTPASTSMLSMQYARRIGKGASEGRGAECSIRAEWMRLGPQYFDLSNNIRQDAYSTLNLRLGVTVRHVGVHAWCRNLTDTRFISYAYDFGAVHLGDPRTMGLTVSRRL